MKIDLEVLASTCIKRKKPWPMIIWIGEEQESLLLLDALGKRISVLYVPSGKTKKLPKLSPFVEQIICFSSTKNGHFLLGILQNGDLFVWHKDKDNLKFVSGLEKHTNNFHTEHICISASGKCTYILIGIGHREFYLWMMEKGETIARGGDIKLKGSWHRIVVPEGMELSSSDSMECTISTVFYDNHVLGHCCQCSMVYNRDSMLNVATLVLKFPDPIDSFGSNVPLFSAEWSLLQYPFQQMHPDFEPISTKGAYVSSYSGSGQVLAVAANQRAPSRSTMLFVSPLTDTVLVGGMKNCGIGDPSKTGRHYWVSDLCWTADNLFLACIMKNGSVCLIPRLGEPIPLQTNGCSVRMGPSYFLALHPAVLVSENQESLEPSAAEQDPLQQHFSVATHPSLPIVLFSDGFLVTVAQLPGEMTSASLMRELVLESAKYMKKLYQQENLDMTVADAYRLSKGHNVSRQQHSARNRQNKPYQFELAEVSLNGTLESEKSFIETINNDGFNKFGVVGNMDAGKILFGEPEMICIDPNATFSGLEASDALLRYLEESMTALTLVWKLASSHCDMWTSDVDNITKQAVHNLSKVFNVVLDCPAVDAIIPVLTPRQSSAIQNPRVYNIIVAYRNILQLLRFDTFNQHLIPAALRLIHKTITLMLYSKELERTDPKIKTLFGCYSLLKHAENSLNRIYVWVPSESQAGTPTCDGSPRRYEPAVMVKIEKQSAESGTDVHGIPLNNKGYLPGNRLAATWKLLYKHALDYYQSEMSNSGNTQDLLQVKKLMYNIQQVLQENEAFITPKNASERLSAGDKLSIAGKHSSAVQVWKEQLKVLATKKKDSPKTAKMLHSILYTYLLEDELAEAVDFIDNLILQASVDIAMGSQELPAYDDGSRPPMMTLVTHRSQDSEEEELVPCIKNKSIRKTVESMGRFMAAYFSNQTMFIYPPHSAQMLPTVHIGSVPTKSRIIPKYHEDITNVITQKGLSSIWTPERTVEYLLLSGLICETTWFAHKMGDWKTAFLLAVAHTSHTEIAPQLYLKPKEPLQLLDSLTPSAILQEKMEILIKSNKADRTPVGANKHYSRYFIPINQETNITQLTKTLQDIMTAGIISDVEIAPWLLSHLTAKLKSVASNLTSLVPKDFYLPAPPLYCPQPGEEEVDMDQPDIQYEKELRMELSSIIQLFLVALNSSHLSLPVARWYIQELFPMQDRASQFKATTEGPCLELPEILQQFKMLRSDIVEFKDHPNVRLVMLSFRDFCSIVWFLHVRDELSLNLRKRGKQLSNDKKDGNESLGSTLAQKYVQECFKILKWAVHMLTFSQYIADDGWIQKVILSLILELPATEDTADILAEHFYAVETFDSEVQEKLERLLSSWQSVEILPEDDGKSAKPEENEDTRKSLENDDDDSVRKSVTFYQASPRAKTLSVYFHKQCEVVQKVLKKKMKCFGEYDEFVFHQASENENGSIPLGMGSDSVICIGSRPFETKQSYLEFLDRFYAICFTKVIQKESESGKAPMYALLMPFAKMIRNEEFQKFFSQNEDIVQKCPSSVVLASPRAKFMRSQSESRVSEVYESKLSPVSGQKKSLLSTTTSGDARKVPDHAGMLRHRSESSLLYKGSSMHNGTPNSPSRAKVNMTGMASRFFQSEDVLYRDVGQARDTHWILDVNFGQRYLVLQHLLDYLHNWAGRQHPLGLHGKNNKELGLKPTMRIEVPSQLVVLGLWLLEHKYSGGKTGNQTQAQNEEVKETVSDLNVEVMMLEKVKQRALHTVEELTEHDSFTQVSNIPRSMSHSPTGQMSHSPCPKAEDLRSQNAGVEISKDRTLALVKSITSTQEETEQMKTAYKKVLDGGDDSSSLEVSSLEPDDYDNDLKQTLSVLGSGRLSRKESPRHKSSARHIESSPDTRNNSVLSHTMQFEGSPERTSTPLNSKKDANRRLQNLQDQPGISHMSMPPGDGFKNNKAATIGGKPSAYSSGLPVGNSVPMMTPGVSVMTTQSNAGNAQSLAGLDLATQLQQIVRGELRRMMEVQHQSMMAMMGALDGQLPPPIVAWQPDIPVSQRQAQQLGQPLSAREVYQNESEGHKETPQEKESLQSALRELKNLEMTEGTRKRLRRSQSSHGKENVDSTLKMSHLKSGENIEVYRLSYNGPDPSNINFYPNFLRIPAERDQENVQFPNLFNEAWNSRDDGILKDRIPEMPLLHVDRTIQAHKFPVSNHSSSLPVYVPQPGYFQSGFGQAPGSFPNLITHFQCQAARQLDSPDSGIGIPLLMLPNEDKGVKHQLRFGELLPPDMVDNVEERQKKAMLHEKYLREYHKLQSEKAKMDFKQRFGDDLLHLEITSQLMDAHDTPTPRKTPMKRHSPHSPRKTPRSLSEQSSSVMSQKRQTTSESVKVDSDVDEQVKSSEKHSVKHGEEEESEDEDATEAEPMTEEEEIHNGYAIHPGEFEAYLSLENQLAQTKDTHARIQLKTALRLQRQRMMENWKRPKVEFATNTEELMEAGTDPDNLNAMEREYVYTSEKATSITKDTGVDPILEAVVEYNKTRRAHVLPPDIYMGLRFAEAGQQPSSDITGHPQESGGRSYLNVVDVNASMVLNDLREKPEHDEPLLNVTLSAAQQQLRNRIAMEDDTRMSLERPNVPTPSHADELTVKLFESKFQGEDRMSLAIMPRDSMPASKYAIMQRLRDMNVQLAAIDQMSNNMEREFKSTRLAIHTLEEMTDAMEAPTKDQQDRYEDQQMSERPTAASGTLSPQPSVKSPTLSTRASARVSARSKKVTVEDKKELSQELAKLSGLSGVSDIIGDMVAKGEIDLDDVGLSRREAEKLFQRGIIRKTEVDEARISLDEIKKMAGKASRDGAEDREALRHWMATKHHKQMEEYRRHLEDLREKESRPFKPATSDRDDQSLTIKERKALAEARDESRKASKREFMTKRLDEAQHLLGNILTDKPELPKELPARVTPKQKPTKDKSPVRLRGHATVKAKMLKEDTSPDRKLHGILKTTDQTQKYFLYDVKEIYNYYDDLDLSDKSINEPDLIPVMPRQISVQPAREPSDQPTRIEVSPMKAPWQKPAGTVPRLRLGLDDVEEEPQKLQNTRETTGELSEYYKAVEAMDVSSSQEQSRDFSQQPQRELDVAKDVPVAKTFKFKPYNKLVKVQRPEITRKLPNNAPNVALDYVASVQTSSQLETSRTSVRSDITQRQKKMIYGSKRIPVKKQPETIPRRVKTYTERLQEMKSKEMYSTPVAPRSHLGSSVASMSTRRVSRPIRPRHKPVTYTQQLQKLNEGYHHQKVSNKTQIITKPMLKSHKPFHRPKTYTQQLQQLQPHKTFKGPSGKRGGFKSLVSRQRPYQDPYAAVAAEDFDQFETASVVSAWSMGDDVRHILYDDVESSLAMGKSSYAPSEQISDYYDVVMGEDDYTASVDIDDLVHIADSGSMSSGSMMSFIDWDQVDDLIADVR